MRFYQKRHLIVCKNLHTKGPLLGLILVLTVLLCGLSYCFLHNLNPTIEVLAEAEANRVGLSAVNQAIGQKVSENAMNYEDLVTIMKDNEGKIAGLQANVLRMNVLKTDITNLILENLYQNDKAEIQVPLMNMFNSNILSGRGPNVPVKLIPIGILETDFANRFTAVGINQTKHEINFTVKMQVSMVLPLGKKTVDIHTEIPVAQTVIVGVVPGTYTNVEGATEAPPDAILNLAP